MIPDSEQLTVSVSQLLTPHSLSREIHLRSLTTGDAHPLAQRHVLEASAAESSRRDSCWIQVSNDILGILFYNASSYNSDMELESNDLVIWNWKAGTMQFVSLGLWQVSQSNSSLDAPLYKEPAP